MSVMLWDSASQAFAEAQTPMVYGKENQAWRDTTGLVWDETNQAWVEKWSPIKYLYDNGSYDKDIVGGFTFIMCNSNNSTQGRLNSDHIYMPEHYGYWESVYTTNKIDLKGFSKLYFDQSTRSDEGGMSR